MQIKEVTNQQDWNDYLLQLHPNTFLQSWQWGQVQQNDGEQVRYLGFFENDVQAGTALLITVKANRGHFLLCPHGPILSNTEHLRESLDLLIKYARELRKAENIVALRIAPLWQNSENNKNIFSQLGFRAAPIHMHAELTWVLDINSDNDSILAGMRKTTRHAIRKAANKGVKIEISTNSKDIDRFLPLYQQTKTRHQFVPFSKEFLKSQINYFLPDNVFLAFARYNNEDVVGAILIQFGDTVFYHHGASKKLPSSVPAAQLLHWEVIQEAKRRGVTSYNFWGISPEDKPQHPFAGITVFKKGFGGRAIDYMHAQDLPLALAYWKLWAVDTYRKIKRGF